jgi:hypothetical protein
VLVGAFGKCCQTDRCRAVSNRPSVRKVMSDRSDRSAHFRTSAASDDGVSSRCIPFSRSVWHRLIPLFTSIDIRIERSVFGDRSNYQPNQRIFELYRCDQTKLRPCSDHLPNAFFCGLTDQIDPIVVSEHTQ